MSCTQVFRQLNGYYTAFPGETIVTKFTHAATQTYSNISWIVAGIAIKLLTPPKIQPHLLPTLPIVIPVFEMISSCNLIETSKKKDYELYHQRYQTTAYTAAAAYQIAQCYLNMKYAFASFEPLEKLKHALIAHASASRVCDYFRDLLQRNLISNKKEQVSQELPYDPRPSYLLQTLFVMEFALILYYQPLLTCMGGVAGVGMSALAVAYKPVIKASLFQIQPMLSLPPKILHQIQNLLSSFELKFRNPKNLDETVYTILHSWDRAARSISAYDRALFSGAELGRVFHYLITSSFEKK